MKKILLLLIIIFILAGCSNNSSNVSSSGSFNPSVSSKNYTSNYITVKYRDSKVDIANPRFEYLNTAGSSFVNGAWYDSGNKYMIIKLKSTYYHYCGLPSNIWRNFKNASSFGTYYNKSIKDRYDCRSGVVPSYN